MMSLCTMKDLLEDAGKNNRAVGSFSMANMESIIGAIMAAEETNTAVILQIAEARFKHSPFHLMGPMIVQAAQHAKVPVAAHLDHGQTIEAVRAALAYGFTSVMFDGSHFEFDENVSRTKEVVQIAAKGGVSVEAELGIVGGNEGLGKKEIRCTDPDEVARFVDGTGVDALAVAIGNAHGNYPVAPTLCFDVLEEIHGTNDIPLVLHGGSGITDEDFRRTIGYGMRKINIATANFNALTQAAKEYTKNDSKPNYFGLNEHMVKAVYETTKHHIKVFNNKEEL